MDRRQLLAAGAVALGGASTVRASTPRKPSLRAAHVTDVHITDAHDAPAAVRRMFRHMQAADWSADVVLNTGDAVMAVDGKETGTRAAELIALWRQAVAGQPPVVSCLGNHDVWDGAGPTAAVPVEKKGFALMAGVLGMPAPYFSADRGGWHIVCLNSVSNWPTYGTLTAEHFDWLAADLRATPADQPVLVLSHLPILSVTSSVYGDECRRGNDVLLPGTWQHADCWAITELFRRHPNVKLCLSGHMHTQDRVEYRGVWYICGGAASGAWWEGAEYGFPPCYGRLDLFADGTFDYRFTDYGWPARGWKGKQLPR